MTDPLRYCLVLSDALEPFRPEIEYVLDVLERYYPVVRVAENEATRHLFYGVTPRDDAIAIPSMLFGNAIGIGADGTPSLDRKKLGPLAKLFPPEDESNHAPAGPIDFDAIGLAYLMLSRIEERNFESGDRYDRYPYAASLAVEAGRYAEPVADIALVAIARRLLNQDHPLPACDYEVVPTHDVDILRGYHRAHEPLRHAAGDLLKRGRPLKSIQRLAAYFHDEPRASFDLLMQLSEDRNLKSRFFFMGSSHDTMDSPYCATMPGALRQTVTRLRDRGHEIGFHPGFETYLDAELWRRQKRSLEEVSGTVVTTGRQHVLRYAADRTPRIWAGAGMKRDYTLAFPEAPGFRNGSCRPVPAWDPIERRALSVDQCATAIMDFGMMGGKYNDWSIEQARAVCRPVINAVKRFRGTLTILQHTGHSALATLPLYRALLEDASK